MLSDLTKYKRFFVFGCSFTSYKWPSWADILSKEMPDAEYYNFGVGGAGNLLINNRVAQANLKYKFNEDDLVIVMFSTFCREDRYIDNIWQTHGNIFNQGFYDKGFVKKYCDPTGYLIRDLALIEMTTSYLNNLPCKSLYLSIVNLDMDEDLLLEKMRVDNEHNAVKLLRSIYEDKYVFPSVVSHSTKVHEFGLTLKGHKNKQERDGHPLPTQYLDFLIEHNFPITDRSIQYVNESMNTLAGAEYWNDLVSYFDDVRKHQAYRDINII